MKIVICRHGDPDYEHDSLTERGKIEAESLAKRISKLEVKDFYVSPLGRAKETAQFTLDKINRSATELDWLHEFKGVVLKDGKYIHCWDKMPSVWTVNDNYYSYDSWYKTPMMKTGNAKLEYNKVAKGIDELLSKYGYNHKGRYYEVSNSNHDTIVLFCHFAVECVIMSHIFGVSPMPLWHNYVALPTSVTTLVSEERENGIASFRCTGFGDVSHLYLDDIEPSFQARFCECFEDETRH